MLKSELSRNFIQNLAQKKITKNKLLTRETKRPRKNRRVFWKRRSKRQMYTFKVSGTVKKK